MKKVIFIILFALIGQAYAAESRGCYNWKNVTFFIFWRYIGYVKKFIEFYHKYQDKLFAYLMRNSGDYYLAGDIMQESFTRYLEKYGGENPTPQLLFTIARNALYDYTRKRIRQAKRLEHLDPADHDQEKKCIVRDEYQRVLAAMQKLDQDDRDILALAASEEFTYREIASVAGISEANVKVKVHRARTRLRNIIREGEVCKRI